MNFKYFTLTIFICVLAVSGCKHPSKTLNKPKLLVSIVVDQMRDEYLYRFSDQFGEGGFKRLMNNGLVCRDVQFNYVPTFTGPGHSSIYTGTTPRYHGIIGNSWYDRSLKRSVYCVEDSTVSGVGTTSKYGNRSASKLLSTTIADELEIFTQSRSLTYSISLKDRAAILPAGHMSDCVLWYDNTTGDFVSSNYYMDELPTWVEQFNTKKLADKYMDQIWDLYLPEVEYDDSYKDDSPYEHPDHVLKGLDNTVFPYDLKEIGKKHSPYDLLIHTPWGNTILADLAIEVIDHAEFGEDDIADMLMISFSSTDAIGHLWGPQSKEIEDTYIRLDKELERLLNALDKKMGKDNYVVMLTADHAVGEVIDFIGDNGIPSGDFKMDESAVFVDSVLDNKYGSADWIEYHRNHIIYLNKEVVDTKGIDLADVSGYAAYKLLDMHGVFQAFSSHQLLENEYNLRGASHVQLGFNPHRSGEIMLSFEPTWSVGKAHAAADHGTQYSYDTHVPLLFYGSGISKGVDRQSYKITDVAPTISLLLDIKFPNSTIGKPIKTLWN